MMRVGVIDGLRSIVYALWFWVVTLGLALLNPVLTRFKSPRWAIASSEAWSGALRWGVEHILGTPVVVEGHFPDTPVLIAIKHESMFEALDLPTLLNRPGIFAKVELLKLPSWGRAGMRYGLVPVERQGLARDVERGARYGGAEPAIGDFSRRHARGTWRKTAAAIGLCRDIQDGGIAGGAGGGQFGTIAAWLLEKARHCHLSHWRNDPAGPAA